MTSDEWLRKNPPSHTCRKWGGTITPTQCEQRRKLAPVGRGDHGNGWKGELYDVRETMRHCLDCEGPMPIRKEVETVQEETAFNWKCRECPTVATSKAELPKLFYRDRSITIGFKRVCKDCSNRYRRKWYNETVAKNPSDEFKSDPTSVVVSLGPELYEALKRLAESQERTIEGQMRWILREKMGEDCT